jgi:hydrogenase maturation protease
MNTKSVDAIAKALLYEGYMLYPYRPSSVKNRQRFNLGVLYPRSYSEQTGSDPWSMQTECLVEGPSVATIEVRARFLKLIARSTECEILERDAASQPWQEVVECDVATPAFTLDELVLKPIKCPFSFPGGEVIEALRDAGGREVGRIVRRQESVQGSLNISAERINENLVKLAVVLKNLTALEQTGEASRDQALMRSLVSAHCVLGVAGGEFVSLLEPPGQYREHAAGCQNIGTWPVLVGDTGQRDTLLSSPIILYDYPQIAPESPGDLFDGTEIDEILALRIMTMTDEEKQEMRLTDDRARQMLERTENLSQKHLMKLHGTLRELRPIREERS